VYIRSSEELGEFPKGQCPPVSEEDLMLIIKSLDNRRDYTTERRINAVTDGVFIRRHPERFDPQQMKIIKLPALRSAAPADQKLIQEWGHIRDCLVIPVHRAWARALTGQRGR
jgi:hypothetical protein